MTGDALSLAVMTMLMPVEAVMFSLLRDFLSYVFIMACALGLFMLLFIDHWLGYWLVAVFFIAAAEHAWKRRRMFAGFMR